MKTFLIVVSIFGLFLFYKSFSSESKTKKQLNREKNQQGNPDANLPEWPVIYQSPYISEIQTLKIHLESKGIETILEDESPGNFGNGVAVEHELRVKPDEITKAGNIIKLWEKRNQFNFSENYDNGKTNEKT